MPNWEVEFDVTPDRPDLATLLDKWCRLEAPTDTCKPADGGAHITHRLGAIDEDQAAQETLDQARQFFKDFEIRHTVTRAVD